MAHLQHFEQRKLSESLYVSLLGWDVYMRWTRIKEGLGLQSETERSFVSWLLDFVEGNCNLQCKTTAEIDMLHASADAGARPNRSISSASATSVHLQHAHHSQHQHVQHGHHSQHVQHVQQHVHQGQHLHHHVQPVQHIQQQAQHVQHIPQQQHAEVTAQYPQYVQHSHLQMSSSLSPSEDDVTLIGQSRPTYFHNHMQQPQEHVVGVSVQKQTHTQPPPTQQPPEQQCTTFASHTMEKGHQPVGSVTMTQQVNRHSRLATGSPITASTPTKSTTTMMIHSQTGTAKQNSLKRLSPAPSSSGSMTSVTPSKLTTSKRCAMAVGGIIKANPMQYKPIQPRPPPCTSTTTDPAPHAHLVDSPAEASAAVTMANTRKKVTSATALGQARGRPRKQQLVMSQAQSTTTATASDVQPPTAKVKVPAAMGVEGVGVNVEGVKGPESDDKVECESLIQESPPALARRRTSRRSTANYR